MDNAELQRAVLRAEAYERKKQYNRLRNQAIRAAAPRAVAPIRAAVAPMAAAAPMAAVAPRAAAAALRAAARAAQAAAIQVVLQRVAARAAQVAEAATRKRDYNRQRNQRVRAAQRRYIDVALRITIEDVRGNDVVPFPRAYKYRTFHSVETFFGASEASINKT